MKTKDETQTARATFGLGKQGKRNQRRSMLLWLPILVMESLNLASRILGSSAKFLVRHVVAPLMPTLAVIVVYAAATVAIVHYGTQVTHWGLSRAAVATDSAYQKIGETRTLLASVLPRFEPTDGAPRATLVSVVDPAPTTRGYRSYPTDAEAASGETAQSGGFLGAIQEAAERVTSLLPDIGAAHLEYPAPPGLPAIEGAVLKKAGGDRIQAVITGVLEGMHQTESSGKLEIIGDNGLAFGPLQVRHEPCEDLKKLFGAEVNQRDCNGDWALSEYVVRLYTGFWAREHEKKTGEPTRGEDILRIWNGGPDMGPFAKTDVYVAKAVRHDPSIATLVAAKQ